MAKREQRGKFVHWPSPDASPAVIERPNKYRGLALDERPTVLTIHGAIDRTTMNGERDSFVITEDHYIDYLARTDLANLIPVTLLARLKRSHFLFLGYSLGDWNLRVILHRIWGERKLSWKSWAVQLRPDPVEREFWDQRGGGHCLRAVGRVRGRAARAAAGLAGGGRCIVSELPLPPTRA